MITEYVEDERHIAVRFLLSVVERFRPPLGWLVFAIGLTLAILPALAIREADWIDLGRVRVNLEWVSFFSLVSAWWLTFLSQRRTAGGRSRAADSALGAVEVAPRSSPGRIHRALVAATRVLVFLLWVALGGVIVSQVLVHWMPGPFDLLRSLNAGNIPALVEGIGADLEGLFLRYADWYRGVEAGGAYQDDFVFLSLFGILLWLLGGAAALLTLKTRNGLIVGAPMLWVLATFLFYGGQGRLLILVGLAATVLLHVLLDQQRLEGSWIRHRTDYSSSLLADRLLSVGAGAVLIGLFAGLMPNIVIRPIAYKVYQTMTPVYDSVDEVTDRMFPDLKGGRRGFGRLGTGTSQSLPTRRRR